MGVMEALRASASEVVELPEPVGLQARIRRIPLDEAVIKGLQRHDLRDAVLAVIGEGAQTGAPLTDEQVESRINLKMLHIAEMVRELRIGDGPWEKVRLHPSELEETFPPASLSVLRDISNGRHTPAMVNALVRRMRREISEEEAVAVIEAETPKLTANWESFRYLGRSNGSGVGGANLGNETKPDAVDLGSPAGA